ncbi:hypothetical protein [Roseibium sediminis]|uniref:hypothetical protein n=1 Tax=Roseibium sediminis TaxID=1775174 RepID=UPI00123D2168|nr:hypothetical protein [Roseibium sediminis]
MPRTAPEIIGFHLGMDWLDVKDGVYQPSRYKTPRVYVCGDDYFCCPTAKQKLPSGFNWKLRGTEYGREIYISAAE